LELNINQDKVDITPHADDTAVDVIRGGCGLTGTKLVCGSGVCGACTVHVDGIPMTSCLLPAQQMEGKQIDTIEQYQGDNLHPIQKAFMAHDGLQCGYCTPGFIMEGIAFYNRWRDAHGTEKPTHEDVADALAGHLCRCGAYAGIYEAVQRACAGEYDNVEDVKPQRVDALEKVTGQAKYTTDIRLEGQLVGRIYRSPHAHAKIRYVSTDKAEKIEGVKAIYKMLPSDKTVRYVGEPLLAIAAVDERTAQQAIDAIEAQYDVLPAVVGIDAGMNPSSPFIWQDNTKNAPSAAEGLTFPGSWNRNVRKSRVNLGGLNTGRATTVFEETKNDGGKTIEAEYVNGMQVHTALEPHCAVAHWKDDQTLDVYISTQSVTALKREIVKHYNLKPENVQVYANHVGGGFGAKNVLSPEIAIAIELAKLAGAPVSIIPNRPEEMATGGMRPGNKTEMKLAANRQNELQAMVVHSYNNSGIAVGHAQAGIAGQVYNAKAKDLQDYDVVNNGGAGAAFRGPGGPGAFWAVEQGIDQMAHDNGLDSLELRRKWTDDDLRLKLYDWVENHEVWQNRPKSGEQDGRYRRGVGIAFGQWFYFYDPDTTVRLETSPDGFTVKMATQDIGNGVKTSLARIVADTFGIRPETVNIEIGSTEYPHGPGAAGSRVTPSVYAPTEEASHLMRDRLFGVIAEEYDLENAWFEDGGIKHAGGMIPWEEALEKIPPQSVEIRRGGDSTVQTVGFNVIKRVMGLDLMFGQGLSQGAVIAEVEVDTLLGKTKVTRVWENLAVGRAYFPDMAMSQVSGGVYQAIGYALYEEKIFDPNTGDLLTSNLQDYRITGIGDVPEVYGEFTDGGFEHAKGNGIGLSELSTMPVAAAIANAVFNATGIRCYESPIKPERLIQALHPDMLEVDTSNGHPAPTPVADVEEGEDNGTEETTEAEAKPVAETETPDNTPKTESNDTDGESDDD